MTNYKKYAIDLLSCQGRTNDVATFLRDIVRHMLDDLPDDGPGNADEREDAALLRGQLVGVRSRVLDAAQAIGDLSREMRFQMADACEHEPNWDSVTPATTRGSAAVTVPEVRGRHSSQAGYEGPPMVDTLPTKRMALPVKLLLQVYASNEFDDAGVAVIELTPELIRRIFRRTVGSYGLQDKDPELAYVEYWCGAVTFFGYQELPTETEKDLNYNGFTNPPEDFSEEDIIRTECDRMVLETSNKRSEWKVHWKAYRRHGDTMLSTSSLPLTELRKQMEKNGVREAVG